MKLLIQFLFIISISQSIKYKKFLNLKNKVFFGNFFEITNLKDDYGHIIPLFTNDGELTEDGYVYYNFFSQRVNGEKTGTIITGETSVGNYCRYGFAMINDDKHIKEHKYLVDIVHKNDASIILKIVNFLDYYDVKNFNETEIIPVYNQKITQMMKKEDIIQIENDFINGVIRAKQSGYDGVIISLNRYNGNNLLYYFFSPEINQRKDEYGGIDIKNRIKILLEIIEKIRIEIGNEYPLGLVISFPDGKLGINEDDIITLCQMAEKSGIDFIQVDTSEKDEYTQYQEDNDENEPINFIIKLSEHIKKIPIVIFKRGILKFQDLKILAEIGVKF